MKLILVLALSALACSSFRVSAVATSEDSATAPAATSSSATTAKISSLLRGSAAAAATATAASSIAEQPPQQQHQQQQNKNRALLWPDQTCYALGYPSGNTDTVPCDAGLLGNCNGAYVCAITQSEAVGLGASLCSQWTVWNNEEVLCPWQYMCCNP
jgi:hypothetical protein